MEWHFAKYRPDETTRDPIVGEFFPRMQPITLHRLLLERELKTLLMLAEASRFMSGCIAVI